MAELSGSTTSRLARATGGLYLLLLPVPVVCFLAAVATDISYARTAFLMWLHFSEWAIAAGLAFGALAALVLLVEFGANRRVRTRAGWTHLVLFYASLLVALANSFVHTIDGWTAVVWTGMSLSLIGAALALAAALALFGVPMPSLARREARP